MRPRRLMSLMVLSLLAGGCCASAKESPPKKVHLLRLPGRPGKLATAQPRDVQANRSWSVEGWGKTREDAEQNALENARLELLAYFAERHYSVEWKPSLDYIKNHLVKDRDDIREEFETPVGWAQGVRLRIEITPEDWQYILREDRLVRSESRMVLLAKLMAGLVAFLGAVAGYLRLEEMTKGYYTAWLRLAAIGFVTVVGAGIWWVS